MGLLAAAVVALIGGMVWAGVVIATHLDVGILAIVVGAAVGMTVVRIAGGTVTPTERVIAGLLAAAGIMVGKYVIFVHAVKVQMGLRLQALGLSVGYLDTRQMGIFVHHLSEIVRPIYILWVALAFFGAYRTAGGSSLWSRRR